MKQFENNATENESPILFIIGNGFDLGLGMKTKYENIYETYIEVPSESNIIKDFKSTLSKRQPYDKWSDFEIGMAEYAKTLSSENELIECVRDFKGHMVEHLQLENEKFIELINNEGYIHGLINELDRLFGEFYKCFSPNLIRQLNSIVGLSFNSEPRIITFNYTTVLDKLINSKASRENRRLKAPLHIHGTLDNDIVLGVDNIEQLKGVSYNISVRGNRAFIKTVFNEQYDSERVLKAKRMISNSKIICTYGFSMGESDKTWINLLTDWLKQNSEHHLIVYQYDETKYPKYNFDALMDIEDERKEKLFAYLNIEDENLRDQIHIPVGYDIFNFKFISITISGARPATPPYNICGR